MNVPRASPQVVALVILADLAAVGLAVVAEHRRNRGKLVTQMDSVTYCHYEEDVSTWYGLGALAALLVGQSVVMVASRCLCCGRMLMEGSKGCVVFLFMACWLTFLVAVACLMSGAAYHINFKHNLKVEHLSCESVRKGVFATGAAFAFFTCVFGVEYYLSYSNSRVDRYYEKEVVTAMRNMHNQGLHSP